MKLFCLLVSALTLAAQTEAPKAPAGRVIGAVTAKADDGKQLTVKSDAGADYTVALDEKTLFLRVAPGEKDLKKATRIKPEELKVGDRVIARGSVNEEQKAVAAVSVIVMTKEDLAQKQQREQEAWQTRGVTGVVKTLTPELVIAARTRQGVESSTTVVPGANAKVRRYAPNSLRFADSVPASAGDIQPGDLVRVLGQKNADGTRIEAEELIFGTFRTIAGTVISVDAANQQIRLKDVDTKKPVAIKLNADTQLKKLSPMIALFLARRLNPTFQSSAAGAGAAGPGAAARPDAGATTPQNGDRRPPAGEGSGAGPGAGRRGGPANMEQMMERLPSFTLAELQPGDALLVSTSARASESAVSAISVWSGVDAILRAAPSGAGASLSGWSLEMSVPAQ